MHTSSQQTNGHITSECTAKEDDRQGSGEAVPGGNRKEGVLGQNNMVAEMNHVEDQLREEIRCLNDKLRENEKVRAQDRDELEGRMQDIRQKAKDHFKQLQEKMQQVVRHKDLRLQELETERTELVSEMASCESRNNDATSRTGLLQECDALKTRLLMCEERESRSEIAGGVAEDIHGCNQEAIRLRHTENALHAELHEQGKQVTDVQQEMGRVRQESEAKIADVVRKAKEHVKQVQTRLESSLGENRDLTEKYREMDESYKQQQEKVTKYKQLMAQANARIEESDENVRDLREALHKSQSQKVALQEQMGFMEKNYSVPPSKEEISQRGGILLAVETETDDIWCLINDGHEGGSCDNDESGAPVHDVTCKNHWWLLSQLDVNEKPIPIQRRWKGEVSALRAQMLRFKKKSEELQDEFENYRQKASVALKTSASQSEEIQTKERRVEQLGEQLQAMTSNLQQAQIEQAKSLEALCETRKRFQEVLSQRNELERALECCRQEGKKKVESALESCTNMFEAQKEALEQKWSEKERTYQQELDLRRAQKESLDEEVEGLRARLANRLTYTMANFETTDVGLDDLPSGNMISDALVFPSKPQKSEPENMLENVDGDVLRSRKSSPRTVSPVTEPVIEAPMELEQTSSGPCEQLQHQSLPVQAYSLHTSVAWQDLVSLRSQVRQLELSLREERQQHGSSRKENDSVKAEIRELNNQQRLQNTVGQHQQMEYIRNVFRKFVESLPMGNKEHEQLIPVLMTFFKFPDEDSKAIQGKRSQTKSQSFWNPLSNWSS